MYTAHVTIHSPAQECCPKKEKQSFALLPSTAEKNHIERSLFKIQFRILPRATRRATLSSQSLGSVPPSSQLVAESMYSDDRHEFIDASHRSVFDIEHARQNKKY
jgi:hypothetical protein